MFRPKNGYDRMSLANFLATSQMIVSRQLGNPAFIKLQPLVNQLNDELPTFIERMQKAFKGSRVDKDLRDETRETMTKLLHTLGFETAALVGDNVALANESAVPFAKKAESAPELQKPAAPILKSGKNAGEIWGIGKKQQANNGITFFITRTPADENSWVPCTGKDNEYLFTGLVSGERYYVKYVLNGARRQWIMSDVSSLIAL